MALTALQADCGRHQAICRVAPMITLGPGENGRESNSYKIRACVGLASATLPDSTQAQHPMCHAKHDIVIVTIDPAIGMTNSVVIRGRPITAEQASPDRRRKP